MKRRRPATRPLILIAVLLLAGAVVNVAVAWGVTLFDPAQHGQPRRGPVKSWHGRVPAHWPSPPHPDVDATRGFATRWVSEGLLAEDPGGSPGLQYYMALTAEAGWPLLSMRGTLALETGVIKSPWWIHGIPVDSPFLSRGERTVRLPLLPHPAGFTGNTIVYAAGLAGLSALPLAIRRRLRARRGRCPKCGYDRAGLTDPAAPCPECGAAR